MTASPSTSGSSTLSPGEAARALFDALNARDLDRVGQLQHEDVFDDFLVLREVKGRAGVRAFFEGLFAAFPDFRLDVVRITTAGDMAIVEWKSDATFTGEPFEGIAANGKRVVLRGVDCMRFEGGRLKHNTIYYDGATFARQVGLLPKQGSGAEKTMTAAFNAVTKLRRGLGGR